MNNYQEHKIKEKEQAISTLEMEKEKEKTKELVLMTLKGIKGTFLVDKKNLELRKSQGYELAKLI